MDIQDEQDWVMTEIGKGADAPLNRQDAYSPSAWAQLEWSSYYRDMPIASMFRGSEPRLHENREIVR